MQIILDEWRSCCDMKGRSVRIQTVKDVVVELARILVLMASLLCGQQMTKLYKFTLVMLKF